MDSCCKCFLKQSKYFKVVLLLGLIKKALKETGRVIQKNEERQINDMMFLKKTYTNGSSNYFDCIVPAQRKLMTVKMTRQTLVQLKRDIVNFLKQLRGNPAKKQKPLPRVSCSMNKVLFPEQNNLPLEGMELQNYSASPAQTLKSQQNSKKGHRKHMNRSFGNYHPSKFQYVQNVIKTQSKNSNNLLMNAKRFKRKIKNQTQVFKKFNCSLSKFYIAPDSTGTDKGSFEIFDLYVTSLFQVKNAVTSHLNDIISNKNEGKERIIYEIKQMNMANSKILEFFQSIGKENENSYLKIRETLCKYREQFAQSPHSESEELMLDQFIKNLTLMMQITKIIMNTPSINHILRCKPKMLPQLLQKLSQFRYLARYLNVQILIRNKNMSKSVKIPQQAQQTENYEQRWRKMFERKYKPIRIIHVRDY